MTNMTLRSLAKDYANGILDKESYRKARENLLRGIAAGEIIVAPIDYRPPLDIEDMEVTRDKTSIKATSTREESRPTTEIVTPEPPRPPIAARRPSNTPLKLILITATIAALCVIVIIVLYMTAEAPVREITSETGSVPLTGQDAVPQGPDTGKLLIEEFLRQNNWSDDSLGQFGMQWNSISDAERTAALAGPEKTQLANAIYRQLLEERALAGLGDVTAAIARQHTLVNFADRVGIEDTRFVVQEIDIPPPEQAVSANPVTETGTIAATQDPPPVEAVATITETVTTVEPERAATETPAPEEVPEEIAVAETTVVDSPVEQPAAGATENLPTTPTESETATGAVQAEPKADVPSTDKHACVAALARQRQPYCRDTLNGIGKGPTLAVVPAGKFMMGGEKPQEQPAHEVTIPSPFAIAVNEITQGEFEQFCADTGRNCPQQPWSDPEYPAVNISWHDAVAYTEWLNKKTGNRYRLPTEAEWEYAARAKTTTPYPSGEEILLTDAVFSGIKPLTSPLPRSDRSINRNKFRLYHMAGNVREWVHDTWNDNYNNSPTDGSAYAASGSNLRVVRGGSYADNADALRSGARTSLAADSADVYTGFRVVQELNP